MGMVAALAIAVVGAAMHGWDSEGCVEFIAEVALGDSLRECAPNVVCNELQSGWKDIVDFHQDSERVLGPKRD